MRRSHILLFAVLFAIGSHAAARAQWAQCDGIYGGSIISLMTMGRYTFATTSVGLFRSTDHGRDWTQVQNGIARKPGIAFNNSTLYFASDRLYISSDSGSTWPVLDSLPCPAGPLAVMGRYLFVCSTDGIYRTSDEGQKWEIIGGLFSSAILVKGSDVYVGSTSGGVHHLSDSGSNWSSVTGNPAIMDSASIDALAYAGNDIFAGGYYGEGFFRSTDNGVTWDTSDVGLPNRHFSAGIEDNFPTILGLYFDGGKLFAAASEGIFLSIDSGASWTQLTSGAVQTIVRSGANLLAGTGQGVSYSSDSGITWKESSDGIQNTNVTAMTSIGTHFFAATNGNGLWSSSDSGATWSPLDSPTAPMWADGIVTIDTTLFVFWRGMLSKSFDYGVTWNSTWPYVFWPATRLNSTLIARGDYGLTLSTDLGTTWEPRSMGWGPSVGYLDCVEGELYDCLPPDEYGVLVSEDMGLTWETLNPPPGIYFTAVYSVCKAGNYLFAASGAGIDWPGYGVFRKADSDTSFSSANGNLPDLSSMAVSSIVSFDSNVVMGTEPAGAIYSGEQSPGIFSSSDFGTSWHSHNEQLFDLNTNVLFVFPPYIFDGTRSAGLWRRPLSELIGQSAVTEVKRPVSSLSVIPNPVSESATFIFTQNNSGYAQISIVNLLGEKVATIFNGTLNASEHSFKWEPARTLSPSGIYECVVRINGQVLTLPISVSR